MLEIRATSCGKIQIDHFAVSYPQAIPSGTYEQLHGRANELRHDAELPAHPFELGLYCDFRSFPQSLAAPPTIKPRL